MVRTPTGSLRGNHTGNLKSSGFQSLVLVVLLPLTLLGVWRPRATTLLLLTGRRTSTWLKICSVMNFILLISGWWITAWRSLLELTMCLTLLLIWVEWGSSSPTIQLLCTITQWSASTCLRRLGSMGLRGLLSSICSILALTMFSIWYENSAFICLGDVNILMNFSGSENSLISDYSTLCRFFYASSACIYPEFKQLETNVSLKESDAWPAEVS